MINDNVKIAGIAHSKLRDAIGLVGIEVDPSIGVVMVKFAKHWSRNEINQIPQDISNIWGKINWTKTIIDYAVGQHLIDEFKKITGFPTRIVDLKKKVPDPNEIRRVKSLDLTEMVQYTLGKKIAHEIQFPDKPSPEMMELEEQIALFTEKTTEAGGVNYYAPGDELDDLTKGLLLSMFAARPLLSGSGRVICGPITINNTPQSITEMFINNEFEKKSMKFGGDPYDIHL